MLKTHSNSSICKWQTDWHRHRNCAEYKLDSCDMSVTKKNLKPDHRKLPQFSDPWGSIPENRPKRI